MALIANDPTANIFNELTNFLHNKQFAEADRLVTAHPELVQHVDSSHRRAVHYAAASGHLEFVQNSLKAEPELVSQEDDSGWDLLLLASSAGHLEIVRHLFATFPNIDVNHRNDTKQSALHYACSKDHLGVAQVLLDNGADVNAQDERGATPLHRAATKGNHRIVNLLMGYRKYLQINLPNREGDTALHLACEDGHSSIALLLANCGADIGRENRERKTPLDLARDEMLKRKLKTAESSLRGV